MALVSMSGGLGTIIGPAFGWALAALGPVFPMFAAAVLAMGAAVWTFRELPEPARRAAPAHGAGGLSALDPRVLPYLLGWVVVFGVFTGVQTVTVAFLADRFGITDAADAGRTMALAMLSMAFVTVFVQAVVLQKWKAPPGRMLRTGFSVMALALLLLAVAPGPWALYLGYALFGMSFGFTAPGLNAAGSLSVRPEEQGAVAGLLSAAPTVGMVFGPMLCGFVYAAAPSAPMLGGAALTVAFLGWLFFVKVPDPRPAAA
jgi:MFS family permease